MADPKYIIGIDLGTTNSVMAFTEAAPKEGTEPIVRIFKIPQLVGPGSMGEREILPSFLLLPGPHDIPGGGLSLPWDQNNSLVVGEFARDRGAEIPHRLIASTKSWLCHTGVDRNKAILPWEGSDELPKLSPVEATAAILRHIKDSWNWKVGADDHLRLEDQEIFLTVPASFDVVARNLTMEAAQMAGLKNPTLLEEPQAALYAWINASENRWRDSVKAGDSILVVDVGGGTTDFSLIKVSEEEGELTLERIAVGEHLLMGGDNMDLTLAYAVAGRMASEGRKLDNYQMRGLCHGCRAAKEYLFENEGDSSFPITILGRGTSLIGSTIKTELTRPDVVKILIDGFFPECAGDAQPRVQRRVGMRELGLSYTSDPAVTHHLAGFLNPKGTGIDVGTDPFSPTAVLFNGGVMKADALRTRVLDLISSWVGKGDQAPIRRIESNDLDLAVAKGAAYYGLVRQGRGIRIRGGLGKTYYIGIEASLPAVPGITTPTKALCVAPFGMEEGTEAALPDKEFGLVIGEPVKFEFLGSHIRRKDTMGTVVEDWEGEVEEITSLEAHLEGETGTTLPVTLEIRITELGTLELWCVSRSDDRKFKLEFNVRERDPHKNG